MYNMSEVSSANNQPIPQIVYEKFGKTEDGRVIVGVKNEKTGEFDKVTVPRENIDKFEKFLNKTNDFVNVGNKFKDNTATMQTIYAKNIIGAMLGGAITATFMKTTSKIKKFFGVTAGALGGVMLSSILIIAGIIKKVDGLAKSAIDIKKLDIQKYAPKKEVVDTKQ